MLYTYITDRCSHILEVYTICQKRLNRSVCMVLIFDDFYVAFAIDEQECSVPNVSGEDEEEGDTDHDPSSDTPSDTPDFVASVSTPRPKKKKKKVVKMDQKRITVSVNRICIIFKNRATVLYFTGSLFSWYIIYLFRNSSNLSFLISVRISWNVTKILLLKILIVNKTIYQYQFYVTSSYWYTCILFIKHGQLKLISRI